MPITYRTAGAWGPATVARNLYASEFDGNNWYLYGLITAIQADLGANVGIVDITESAGSLYVTLSNSSMLGPFPIPVYSLADAWRGPWNPTTIYHKGDVITFDGSVYVVLLAHTSAGTFDPGANDGLGHNYYGLFFTIPADVLPLGGTTGQALVKLSNADLDDGWATLELANLGDVGLGSPHNTNDLLAWAGSHWTNMSFANIGAVLENLADVTVTSPNDGDLLKWDGFSWVNYTPLGNKIQTVTSSSGTLIIDYSLGANCQWTMTEDVADIVVTNWPATDIGKLTLFVSNSGSTYAITGWVTGMKWPGGIAPTVGPQDIYVIVKNTLQVTGSVVGQDYL